MTPDERRARAAYHFRALQDRFVEAWHKLPPSLSTRERARRAAIEAGYSPKTAQAAGTKLVSKPHILERLLGAHPRARAEKAGIDAVWLLSELADLWDQPLAELFDERGRLLDIRDMPPLAQKLIAGFDVEETTEEHDGQRHVSTRVAKIKLIDRLSVLQQIGRNHLVGAFRDPKQDEAHSSLAELMRAMTRSLQGSTTELEINPRRLTNGAGSQDE